MKSLRLMQNYLANRKQRTKFNLTYSTWEEILFGVRRAQYLVLFFSASCYVNYLL